MRFMLAAALALPLWFTSACSQTDASSAAGTSLVPPIPAICDMSPDVIWSRAGPVQVRGLKASGDCLVFEVQDSDDPAGFRGVLHSPKSEFSPAPLAEQPWKWWVEGDLLVFADLEIDYEFETYAMTARVFEQRVSEGAPQLVATLGLSKDSQLSAKHLVRTEDDYYFFGSELSGARRHFAKRIPRREGEEELFFQDNLAPWPAPLVVGNRVVVGETVQDGEHTLLKAMGRGIQAAEPLIDIGFRGEIIASDTSSIFVRGFFYNGDWTVRTVHKNVVAPGREVPLLVAHDDGTMMAWAGSSNGANAYLAADKFFSSATGRTSRVVVLEAFSGGSVGDLLACLPAEYARVDSLVFDNEHIYLLATDFTTTKKSAILRVARRPRLP